MISRVFDLHHQRIQAENEDKAAAHKAGVARIKRKQKRVVSFERDVKQIEDWLDDNHPNYTNKRQSTSSMNLDWKKIQPRIAKIQEKGSSSDATFGTQCNALEALTSIARALFVNSRGGIGCNVIGYFEQPTDHDEIPFAMMKILETMTQEEATKAVSEDCNGVPLGLKITRVWSMCMNGRNGTPFKSLKDVLEGMGIDIEDPIPNADNPEYPIRPPTMSRSFGSGLPPEGVVEYYDNSL